MNEKGVEKATFAAPNLGTSLERAGKLLRVVDKRSPDFPSAFDLEAFVQDLNVAMDARDLFRAGITRYGKYFQIATAESDHFTESLRDARAIMVTVEHSNRMMPMTGQSQTVVTIDAAIDRGHVKRTQLRFNEDGTYRAGSLTRDLREDEQRELEKETVQSLESKEVGNK